MKVLFLAVLLSSTVAWGSDHYLKPGTNTRIEVSVAQGKGAMIVLPRYPKTITGKTRPFFQVEVYGEKIMVTPLKIGVAANLFVDLGDRTIATIGLTGVEGEGEDLVNLHRHQQE